MILLDTHALVWWANETENLSSRSRRIIDREEKDGAIAASAISAWEICLLIKLDGLPLQWIRRPWFRDLEILPYFRFCFRGYAHCKNSSVSSELDPKDPADRIIVATALRLGVPLITKDEKIRRSKLVRTIW